MDYGYNNSSNNNTVQAQQNLQVPNVDSSALSSNQGMETTLQPPQPPQPLANTGYQNHGLSNPYAVNSESLNSDPIPPPPPYNFGMLPQLQPHQLSQQQQQLLRLPNIQPQIFQQQPSVMTCLRQVRPTGPMCKGSTTTRPCFPVASNYVQGQQPSRPQQFANRPSPNTHLPNPTGFFPPPRQVVMNSSRMQVPPGNFGYQQPQMCPQHLTLPAIANRVVSQNGTVGGNDVNFGQQAQFGIGQALPIPSGLPMQSYPANATAINTGLALDASQSYTRTAPTLPMVESQLQQGFVPFMVEQQRNNLQQQQHLLPPFHDCLLEHHQQPSQQPFVQNIYFTILSPPIFPNFDDLFQSKK